MKKTSDLRGAESASGGRTAIEPRLRKWIGAAVATAVFATLVVIGCSVKDNPASGGDEPGTYSGGGTSDNGNGNGNGNGSVAGGDIKVGDIMAQNPSLPVSEENESDKYVVKEGEPFVDSRSGRSYKTVVIQDKTGLAKTNKMAADPASQNYNSVLWLAEDVINSGTGTKPTDYLMTWDQAQKACPGDGKGNDADGGWVVPTRADWVKLVKAVGTATTAGDSLKGEGGGTGQHDGEKWVTKNGGGQGALRFNAKPRGYKDLEGVHRGVDSNGLWWTRDEGISGTAYYRGMTYNNKNVIENYYGKSFQFALRCVYREGVGLWIPSGGGSGGGTAFKVTVTYSQTGGKDDGKATVVLKSDGKTEACSEKTPCNTGTEVIITATANTGYRFKNWSGDMSGTNSSVVAKVKGNANITANFEPITWTLTLNKAPTSGGTVKVNTKGGAQEAVSSGKTKTYNQTDEVTVIAEPADPGYKFNGWTVVPDTKKFATGDVTTSTITIKMTDKLEKEDITLTANFTKVYTLTVNWDKDQGSVSFPSQILSLPGTTGSSTSPPLTATMIDEGRAFRLTAVPATNYEFNAWTGGIAGKTTSIDITMTKNINITATFKEIGKSSGGGSLTPVGQIEQVWSTPNEGTVAPSGADDRNCYGGKSENCGNNYGALYDWVAAKNVCKDKPPEGGVNWRLPTRKDWDALVKRTGVVATSAAGVLKAKTGWDENDDSPYNGKGFDDINFLPGGYRDTKGNWRDRGVSGVWWIGEEDNNGNAYYAGMSQKLGSITINAYSKDYLFSVRCVRDVVSLP